MGLCCKVSIEIIAKSVVCNYDFHFRTRGELVVLINELSSESNGASITNEDSNSLEIEKPIIDTGQVSSNDDETSNSEELPKSENETFPTVKKLILKVHSGDKNDVSIIQESTKRKHEDEPKSEKIQKVSEEITEETMIVQGEGSGEDNDAPNPIVGEEICENVLYVYGEGAGVENTTANTEQAKEENEKGELDTKKTSQVPNTSSFFFGPGSLTHKIPMEAKNVKSEPNRTVNSDISVKELGSVNNADENGDEAIGQIESQNNPKISTKDVITSSNTGINNQDDSSEPKVSPILAKNLKSDEVKDIPNVTVNLPNNVIAIEKDVKESKNDKSEKVLESKTSENLSKSSDAITEKDVKSKETSESLDSEKEKTSKPSTSVNPPASSSKISLLPVKESPSNIVTSESVLKTEAQNNVKTSDRILESKSITPDNPGSKIFEKDSNRVDENKLKTATTETVSELKTSEETAISKTNTVSPSENPKIVWKSKSVSRETVSKLLAPETTEAAKAATNPLTSPPNSKILPINTLSECKALEQVKSLSDKTPVDSFAIKNVASELKTTVISENQEPTKSENKPKPLDQSKSIATKDVGPKLIAPDMLGKINTQVNQNLETTEEKSKTTPDTKSSVGSVTSSGAKVPEKLRTFENIDTAKKSICEDKHIQETKSSDLVKVKTSEPITVAKAKSEASEKFETSVPTEIKTNTPVNQTLAPPEDKSKTTQEIRPTASLKVTSDPIISEKAKTSEIPKMSKKKPTETKTITPVNQALVAPGDKSKATQEMRPSASLKVTSDPIISEKVTASEVPKMSANKPILSPNKETKLPEERNINMISKAALSESMTLSKNLPETVSKEPALKESKPIEKATASFALIVPVVNKKVEHESVKIGSKSTEPTKSNVIDSDSNQEISKALKTKAPLESVSKEPISKKAEHEAAKIGAKSTEPTKSMDIESDSKQQISKALKTETPESVSIEPISKKVEQQNSKTLKANQSNEPISNKIEQESANIETKSTEPKSNVIESDSKQEISKVLKPVTLESVSKKPISKNVEHEAGKIETKTTEPENLNVIESVSKQQISKTLNAEKSESNEPICNKIELEAAKIEIKTTEPAKSKVTECDSKQETSKTLKTEKSETVLKEFKPDKKSIISAKEAPETSKVLSVSKKLEHESAKIGCKTADLTKPNLIEAGSKELILTESNPSDKSKTSAAESMKHSIVANIYKTVEKESAKIDSKPMLPSKSNIIESDLKHQAAKTPTGELKSTSTLISPGSSKIETKVDDLNKPNLTGLDSKLTDDNENTEAVKKVELLTETNPTTKSPDSNPKMDLVNRWTKSITEEAEQKKKLKSKNPDVNEKVDTKTPVVIAPIKTTLNVQSANSTEINSINKPTTSIDRNAPGRPDPIRKKESQAASSNPGTSRTEKLKDREMTEQEKRLDTPIDISEEEIDLFAKQQADRQAAYEAEKKLAQEKGTMNSFEEKTSLSETLFKVINYASAGKINIDPKTGKLNEGSDSRKTNKPNTSSSSSKSEDNRSISRDISNPKAMGTKIEESLNKSKKVSEDLTVKPKIDACNSKLLNSSDWKQQDVKLNSLAKSDGSKKSTTQTGSQSADESKNSPATKEHILKSDQNPKERYTTNEIHEQKPPTKNTPVTPGLKATQEPVEKVTSGMTCMAATESPLAKPVEASDLSRKITIPSKPIEQKVKENNLAVQTCAKIQIHSNADERKKSKLSSPGNKIDLAISKIKKLERVDKSTLSAKNDQSNPSEESGKVLDKIVSPKSNPKAEPPSTSAKTIPELIPSEDSGNHQKVQDKVITLKGNSKEELHATSAKSDQPDSAEDSGKRQKDQDKVRLPKGNPKAELSTISASEDSTKRQKVQDEVILSKGIPKPELSTSSVHKSGQSNPSEDSREHKKVQDKVISPKGIPKAELFTTSVSENPTSRQKVQENVISAKANLKPEPSMSSANKSDQSDPAGDSGKREIVQDKVTSPKDNPKLEHSARSAHNSELADPTEDSGKHKKVQDKGISPKGNPKAEFSTSSVNKSDPPGPAEDSGKQQKVQDKVTSSKANPKAELPTISAPENPAKHEKVQEKVIIFKSNLKATNSDPQLSEKLSPKSENIPKSQFKVKMLGVAALRDEKNRSPPKVKTSTENPKTDEGKTEAVKDSPTTTKAMSEEDKQEAQPGVEEIPAKPKTKNNPKNRNKSSDKEEEALAAVIPAEKSEGNVKTRKSKRTEAIKELQVDTEMEKVKEKGGQVKKVGNEKGSEDKSGTSEGKAKDSSKKQVNMEEKKMANCEENTKSGAEKEEQNVVIEVEKVEGKKAGQATKKIKANSKSDAAEQEVVGEEAHTGKPETSKSIEKADQDENLDVSKDDDEEEAGTPTKRKYIKKVSHSFQPPTLTAFFPRVTRKKTNKARNGEKA